MMGLATTGTVRRLRADVEEAYQALATLAEEVLAQQKAIASLRKTVETLSVREQALRDATAGGLDRLELRLGALEYETADGTDGPRFPIERFEPPKRP